jgi:hypothetical protein
MEEALETGALKVREVCVNMVTMNCQFATKFYHKITVSSIQLRKAQVNTQMI